MTEDDTPSEADRLEHLLEAMVIWERHLQESVEQWHEGVSESAREYREGLAAGLGVEPEEIPDETVEHWKEGVMETGSEAFATAIRDEGADWLVGMYEGVTGRDPPPHVQELAEHVERVALERAGEDASDEELANALREALRARVAESYGSG